MEVKIPHLAESVTEGEIGTWLKKDGEAVQRGEAILELQTDKASLELAAETSGILRTLKAEGDVVHVGEIVARIEEAAGAAGASQGTAAPAKPAAPAPSPREPASAPRREASPPPAAESQSAPPAPVSSSTPPATTPAQAPAAPETSSRPESRRPARIEPGTRRERMSLLRRRIAERLVQAQHEAAILTTFNEVDMSAAMALREEQQEWFTKRYGVKLGYMSLFGRAVVHALGEIPALNASIDGEDVVYRDAVHLGIAVQTDKGLVVPVVRDAHSMGLGALEKEVARLASLARAGRLGIEDLQGASFTISNGGIFGSLLSTPILNPPQVGILGMHSIQQRPVCLPDGGIAARPMMYVALSYDHRLIDGREAVTFLVKVKQQLEDPRTMILGG